MVIMMYKNYIFDCGNVLRGWDLTELGLIFFEKDDMLKYLSSIHDNWEELDKGMLEDEYFDKYKHNIPERLYPNFRNLLYKWIDYFKPIDGMMDIIRKLKDSGHKVYILSNMPHVFVDNIDKFNEVREFDGTVFSCDIKMIKPNKEIFEYLLNKYNLDPKESVFIDDLDTNILGAKNSNIDGFIFDKHNVNAFKEFVKKNENIDL